MANPIFQTVTVAKGQLYNQLKTILTNAGWTNVSSNSSTDYDVFQSAGEDGTRNLLIQMRDFYSSGTAAANSITNNATQVVMAIRLINGYTPGSGGASGTFARSTTWSNLFIAPGSPTVSTINLNTQMTITYHCNKNRLIFFVETPSSLNLLPVGHYIGLPDDMYCTEFGAVGTVYASSNCHPDLGAGGRCWANDHPSDYPSRTTDVVSYDVSAVVTPKNPNSAGKYHLSDMFYSHSSIGLRGRVAGIYTLPTTGLLNGDQITVGSETYRVFILNNTVFALNGYCRYSFPTTCIAVRVV